MEGHGKLSVLNPITFEDSQTSRNKSSLQTNADTGFKEKQMKPLTLDLVGLRCPEPMMLLRKTVRKMETSQEVHVETDDPSTLRDFPKFCEFQEHTLVHMTEGAPNKFTIKKGK